MIATDLDRFAPCLLDTNILLRLAEPQDSLHLTVVLAVERLINAGNQPCYAPQNLVEFWNVLTRPKTRNGFGLAPAIADHRATLLERQFRLLPDNPLVHAEWRRLVVAHSVSGRQVHDARVAAAMVVHGVRQILTLNTKDFERYPPILAVDPQNFATEEH